MKMTDKKDATITKKQAAIETLRPNFQLKQLSIYSIFGSILIYGASLTSSGFALIVSIVLSIVSSYFFFKSHTLEKYLTQKYNIIINNNRYQNGREKGNTRV